MRSCIKKGNNHASIEKPESNEAQIIELNKKHLEKRNILRQQEKLRLQKLLAERETDINELQKKN